MTPYIVVIKILYVVYIMLRMCYAGQVISYTNRNNQSSESTVVLSM